MAAHPTAGLARCAPVALLGFFGFTLYNVALNAGEVGVTAGTASFLIGSAPVFIALGAVAFLGERLTWWGWFGSAVSFSGVAVISLLTQEGGEAAGLQLNGWALLVVIAAGAGATYSVSMKPMLKKYGALRTTTYAIWTGTLLLLIYLPGLLADAQTAPMDATLAVIYMGVIPGAIGYVCWSYVLSKIPTSVAGSLLYLIPLLATLIAWVWLGEVPGAATFVGGVLIIAGVVVVNRLGRHRPQPR